MSGDPSGKERTQRLMALLSSPRYELVPLSGVLDQARHLPRGATVTVTASPSKGLSATIEVATALAAEGFRVVPHLAARQVRDRGELETILARLDAADVTEAFVVGGDATDYGAFGDGLSLLEAMAEVGHPFERISVPAYPDGHSFIPDEVLRTALDAKTDYATSATTQMCFNDVKLRSWLRAERSRGMALPVYLGIPGVAPLRRLVAIATRIGVADSTRFLSSNPHLLGSLVRHGRYAPGDLLMALTDVIEDATAGVVGFHIFTFNQVETTERWRTAFLAELDGRRSQE